MTITISRDRKKYISVKHGIRGPAGTTNASNITSGTLALARGGTGASLTDPGADRLYFWDESANATAFLTLGTGLSITGTTIDASTSGGTWGSITGTLSAQTDLQSALNLKANSSSLATVATTGAYSDLSGTPSIPTAANPTAAGVGLTAINGSASTFMRSDGAPALNQGIAPTWTGAHAFSNTITQTSNSATAFQSGPNGGTNPVFRLVNSAASSATGLSITGNAAGSGVTLSALSSGTNEKISINPKGSGIIDSTGTAFSLLGGGGQGGALLVGAAGGTEGLRVVRATSTSVSTNCQALRFYALDDSSNGIVIDSNGSLGGTSAMTLRWGNSTAFNSTADTFLRRSAAANLALGNADAASPVAQTLSVQNVVAGTSNTSGANWTFAGSRGTGTGDGGAINFQVAPRSTTGSTQNTLATVLSLATSSTSRAVGFFGATPVVQQSVGAAATDAATTLTLANNLRTALINLGLCTT